MRAKIETGRALSQPKFHSFTSWIGIGMSHSVTSKEDTFGDKTFGGGDCAFLR